MAVLPSAETATELPCAASIVFPVPTHLSPCCVPGKGVGVTEKLSELLAVPPAVITEIVPVFAPGITMPTSVVPSFETAIAETPPIVNADGLLRFVPLIVTNVPTGPDNGLNDVIVGGDGGMNTQAAPCPKLSTLPPTMAVLPSAETATE